ncbi:MAG: cytochrome c [Ignavibacteriales bacterium]|nr:MAG: cytochrome c [Ignavibacteriales bacterium]
MNNLKNKIEELKSHPEKAFGLIYPYILIVVITIGLYYVTNLGNIARQNLPLVAVTDTTQISVLPVVEPRTVPPIDIMEYSKANDEILAKGKETYSTICASCHGEDGKGNGAAATGLNPPPRDFTNKSNWKNGQKISGIYETLEHGIPGTGMISYNYLPPADRIAMAHYIRETFIPQPPADSESELTQLDQLYSLSQGKEIPAQIPVETAMGLIIEENNSVYQELMQKVNQANSDNSAGSKIFSRIASNKIQAMATLNSDKSWVQSNQRFMSAIVYNVQNNGFNSNIFKLSSDEWDILYNYMTSLF